MGYSPAGGVGTDREEAQEGSDDVGSIGILELVVSLWVYIL